MVTSGLRMAFGGDFFTDVSIAGLVTFVAILVATAPPNWAARTRPRDQAVDADRLNMPGTGSPALFRCKTARNVDPAIGRVPRRAYSYPRGQPRNAISS